MEIDNKMVKKIAQLAHVRIDDNNIPEIQKDLNRIVSFVNKLNEIDISEVEEFKFGEMTLLEMRSDETKKENQPEEILLNTDDKKEGFFVVPKIVE
jgi:aspartyl-tRNA(Asn)/glutamyl-tRNA(Gln) amidotransferase subunit C